MYIKALLFSSTDNALHWTILLTLETSKWCHYRKAVINVLSLPTKLYSKITIHSWISKSNELEEQLNMQSKLLLFHTKCLNRIADATYLLNELE